MKKLSILAILVIVFSTLLISSVCFAAGSYSVSSISFKMDEPKRGEYPPTNVTGSAYNCKFTIGEVHWVDPNNVRMGANKVFIDGKYKVSFAITKTGGDNIIPGRTTVYVNDVKGSLIAGDETNQYYVHCFFEINGAPITGRLSNASGAFSSGATVKINNIDFTLPEPEFGKETPKMDKLTYNEVLKDKIVIENVSWFAEDDDARTDIIQAGVKYEMRLFIKAADGYEIANDAIVTLNGEKTNFRKIARNEFNLSKYYGPYEGQRPSTSTSTGSRPTTGSTASRPSTSNTTTEETSSSNKIAEMVAEIIASQNSGNKISGELKPSEGTTRPIASLLPSGALDLEEAKEKEEETSTPSRPTSPSVSRPTVSGNSVNTRPSTSTTTEETKPEEKTETTTQPDEKKWINQFLLTVTEPKIGEKPSTEVKAASEGFKVGKVTWTPDDKTFKEGVAYTIKVMITIDEGRDLRSDYFGLVNDKQGYMPQEKYEKDNFYLEYTWRPLHNAVNWATASKWALEELQAAKAEDIIPVIFDKEDLTQNITRKEFAHVAVLLYEEISGVLVKPIEKNPFTDTKDEEILKAYNVGITKGTSETTFDPDALITREQMATMMTRALSEAGIDTTLDKSKIEKFSDDADISSWATDSVYFMANAEIIKGMGDGSFGAKGNASREQALLISHRSVSKFK